MLNSILQWAGTACLLTMYILMNFYPNLYPWNIVAFLIGTVAFLAWTVRVANKPQLLVNVVALTLGAVGLYKAFLT